MQLTSGRSLLAYREYVGARGANRLKVKLEGTCVAR
jgi:hypothetical protein